MDRKQVAVPNVVRPEPGFYHHFKRNPNGPITEGTYEVLMVVKDTEHGGLNVIYRPLYETKQEDEEVKADAWSRPLEMFTGLVSGPRGRTYRFARVTDQDLIDRLTYFRNKMYKTARR